MELRTKEVNKYDGIIWSGMDFSLCGMRVLWKELVSYYNNHFIIYRAPRYKRACVIRADNLTVGVIGACHKDYVHTKCLFIDTYKNKVKELDWYETGIPILNVSLCPSMLPITFAEPITYGGKTISIYDSYISTGNDIYDNKIWPGMDFNHYGERMILSDMEKLYPNHFVMYKNPEYKGSDNIIITFIAVVDKKYRATIDEFIKCNENKEDSITCIETGRSRPASILGEINNVKLTANYLYT